VICDVLISGSCLFYLRPGRNGVQQYVSICSSTRHPTQITSSSNDYLQRLIVISLQMGVLTRYVSFHGEQFDSCYIIFSFQISLVAIVWFLLASYSGFTASDRCPDCNFLVLFTGCTLLDWVSCCHSLQMCVACSLVRCDC
jgi:hypothetical protein